MRIAREQRRYDRLANAHAVIANVDAPAELAAARFQPDVAVLDVLMPGITDGRFFARLGIQTYGFLPMRLRAEMKFTSLIHAADERVPAQEIGWGTDRICEVLTRYR